MRILYIVVLLALALSLKLYDIRANFEIYRREKGGVWYRVQNVRTHKKFWTQDRKDTFKGVVKVIKQEEYEA